MLRTNDLGTHEHTLCRRSPDILLLPYCVLVLHLELKRNLLLAKVPQQPPLLVGILGCCHLCDTDGQVQHEYMSMRGTSIHTAETLDWWGGVQQSPAQPPKPIQRAYQAVVATATGPPGSVTSSHRSMQLHNPTLVESY